MTDDNQSTKTIVLGIWDRPSHASSAVSHEISFKKEYSCWWTVFWSCLICAISYTCCVRHFKRSFSRVKKFAIAYHMTKCRTHTEHIQEWVSFNKACHVFSNLSWSDLEGCCHLSLLQVTRAWWGSTRASCRRFMRRLDIGTRCGPWATPATVIPPTPCTWLTVPHTLNLLPSSGGKSKRRTFRKGFAALWLYLKFLYLWIMNPFRDYVYNSAAQKKRWYVCISVPLSRGVVRGRGGHIRD